MTTPEIIASVLMLLGGLLTVATGIGVLRMPDALTSLHSISVPQVPGLVLILAGVVVVQPSFATFAIALVVVGAQMVTIPAASTMLGRAGFRRELVHGSRYFDDELTPRLARTDDEDEDKDGFVDDDHDETRDMGGADRTRFPENVVTDTGEFEDLSRIDNWEQPEVRRPDPDDADPAEDDLDDVDPDEDELTARERGT